MVFKDSPSLLGKGEGENLEEILAEKVKLSHFTQKVLQSWLITVTVKTISRPPIQSFPGHWQVNTPTLHCAIQSNDGQD